MREAEYSGSHIQNRYRARQMQNDLQEVWGKVIVEKEPPTKIVTQYYSLNVSYVSSSIAIRNDWYESCPSMRCWIEK